MFASAVTRFDLHDTLPNIIQEELLWLKLWWMSIIPLLLDQNLWSVLANRCRSSLADNVEFNTLLLLLGQVQLVGLCFNLCLDGLFLSIAFGGTLKLLVATLVPFDRLWFF